VNNKYTIAAATIFGIVIAITFTYSNFNLPVAFGDHGEEFADTYEDWYEERDDSSNY